MSESCVRHPMNVAEFACGRCGHDFCPECVVFPYGLGKPPRSGGWVASADGVGYVCCVEQGHYGHRARKLTWLYAVGTELPGLVWGPSEALLTRGEVYASEAERRRAVKTGAVQRMSRRERAATPAAFREVLLGIARSAVWRRRETA